MKRKVEIGFSLMLVLVFAFSILEARGWQTYARLLPWALGFPMLVLAIAQLAADIRAKRTEMTPVDHSESTPEISTLTVRRRTVYAVAWILGLFAGIWLLGFPISIPLFTFIYLKIESEESWAFALVLSVVAWLFFFSLFVWTLNLPFPSGELFVWLNDEGP